MNKIKYLLLVLSLMWLIPVQAIEKDFKKEMGEPSPTSEQTPVEVYLFGTDSCQPCQTELEYLSYLQDNYGLVKVYYYDIDIVTNYEILIQVANFRNEEIEGIPYTIIGNASWFGFSDEIAEEMGQKISEEYSIPDTDRYDIMFEVPFKKQIPVYMFYDQNDADSLNAAEIFESLETEYSFLLYLVKLEVTIDQSNKEVMDDIAKFKGEEVKSYPYILIGNKSWQAINESLLDEMFDEIIAEYEKEEKDRYDIITEWSKNNEPTNVYIFHDSSDESSAALEMYKYLSEAYPTMLKLVAYDLSDAGNLELMKKVARYNHDTVTTYPYIVIADKSWVGYMLDNMDEMTSKIDEDFMKPNDSKYNVMNLLKIKGDLNNDDNITLTDVLLELKIFFNSLEPNSYQLLAADINNDNNVNLTDILLLLKAFFSTN